jgi:hypothetical protein
MAAYTQEEMWWFYMNEKSFFAISFTTLLQRRYKILRHLRIYRGGCMNDDANWTDEALAE